MKLLNKSILIAIVASLTVSTYAQEEEPAPTFSVAGSIDTYFRSSEAAPGTSFANLPGFSMGMANIIMDDINDMLDFLRDIEWDDSVQEPP